MTFPVDNWSYRERVQEQAFALISRDPQPDFLSLWEAVQIVFSHRNVSRKLLRSVLKFESCLRSASTFLIEWITVE